MILEIQADVEWWRYEQYVKLEQRIGCECDWDPDSEIETSPLLVSQVS